MCSQSPPKLNEDFVGLVSQKEFVFGGSGFGSVTDSRDRQERGLKYGHPQSITFFQESLRKKFFQSSWILERIYVFSLNSKIVCLDFFYSRYWTYYLSGWFPWVVSFFSFIFILVASLTNHNKSYKNYKKKIIILLDYTWEDLYSGYIIYYTLL